MKFCKDHWEKLQTAINERGLSDLVSGSGEELARRMKIEMEAKKTTPESFDPLMTAHNMIVKNALQAGGVYMLSGDFCPLCELNKNAEEMQENADDWIRKSADGVAQFAVELGVRSAQ